MKNNGLFETHGAASMTRLLALLLVGAGVFVSVFGFCYADKDSFDVMMVAGMLIGSGLTGKLVQKKMERPLSLIVVLLLLVPMLSGCALIGGGAKDTGYLEVRRDKQGQIKEITFVQPEAAKEASTFEFNATKEGDVSGIAYMGYQYNTKGIAETFRAFRIWHITGVGLVLIGVVLLIGKRFIPGLDLVSTKAPWICFGAGIGCATLGHIIPAYGKWIAIVGVVVGVGVGLYTIYKKRPEVMA